MEILIFIAVIAVGVFVYRYKQYQKTTYYKITKKPYWFMDKGARGEYLTYLQLKHFENIGGKFLFNLYIPKKKGGTTEIDVLLITKKGLFVFESKNYGGWIFGDESNKNWTQTFPAGYGRSHKERFYNPIMQNAAHITHLRPFIKDTPVWSIIVFSDECTLKNITLRSLNVRVINRYEVGTTVTRISMQTQIDALTEEDLNSIYNRLFPYTQVGCQAKEAHVNNIQGI
ncbi:MAG: NERD domain-containing protein [Alphaproteobacteria bacterium]|nr:NERD domain-containing protein [Alphaproteobacteria bacterium]